MPPPIYRRILGPRAVLHPAVAALHTSSPSASARGSLAVTRGRSLRARLIGWLLRFPRQAASVPVVVVISRDHRREHWSRRFGSDRVLQSWQTAGPDGLLRERYGPIELELTVRAVDGGLVLTGHRTALRAGRLRCPLPGVTPQVQALVRPAAAASVNLEVRVGLGGQLLLGYSGVMDVEPGEHPPA